MNITMSLTQLRALLVDAAEVGAKRALIDLGMINSTLTKAQAYRSAGRAQIERWIKEGLLHPVRDSSGNARWRFDRHELDSVIKASNRHTFLNTDERL